MPATLAADALIGASVLFASSDRGAVDSIEAQAIERARGGDQDAFDVLVERWARRVTSLAWTVTSSRDAAEEIAQETFVRAWQTLRRFRAGSPFGPWILRIATNLSVDHLRRAKRFESIETASEILTGRLTSPEVRAESSETAERIDRAIAILPEMQRVVARLFLIEEYDHDEIAAMTGLAAGTVRSHLSIARAKLREALRNG
jgi:RNA polymerase sigma-70 factor, ECF subfamily